LMVGQAEEQQGQGVALGLVEDGEEIGAAHERQGSGVVHHTDEVDEGGHHAAEDDHQHSEVLVHSFEQAVEGQGEEDQDDRAGQLADDAKTEEPLVRGDVAGRGGGVAMDEQLAGNVDEAEGAAENEEQVPEFGDSAWVAG
jgi:hypothetical protein